MRNYFYGWYFRCQSPEGTIAVIPAVHLSREESSCSIQVITEDGAWKQTFPVEQFHINRERSAMRIGENLFSKKGVHLKITEDELDMEGELRFGTFTEPAYDIMGPFQRLPGMECRHAIYSMYHEVNGQLYLNGRSFRFERGAGYMEGDSGTSFPENYIWTQHFFGGDSASIMLAAAKIPFGWFHFTGTIGIVWWREREYRFATYLGAKVEKLEEKDGVVICQGSYQLKVVSLDRNTKELNAPCNGEMTRTIGEDISCQVEYTLLCQGKVLFQFRTERAALEYEM